MLILNSPPNPPRVTTDLFSKSVNFSDGSVRKESIAVHETLERWVRSLGWEDTLEKEMATHSRILGEFHERRNLARYIPRGSELDMT